MTKEALWERLSKLDMSIDAQRALNTNRQFELAGQWSRRMRHSSEAFERIESRREFVAKRS